MQNLVTLWDSRRKGLVFIENRAAAMIILLEKLAPVDEGKTGGGGGGSGLKLSSGSKRSRDEEGGDLENDSS